MDYTSMKQTWQEHKENKIKELLDLLKANGTQSYKATIKVYGEKDGKADLTNLVALKEVTVNLHKEAMEMEKNQVKI